VCARMVDYRDLHPDDVAACGGQVRLADRREAMKKKAAKVGSKAKPVEVVPIASSLDKRLSMVALGDLKPHPRNYRVHLDDQLAHIVESLKEYGFYRNVVVARDGTILAGHGVVEAARRMELRAIPVIRLDLDSDDPRALKVLTGDNEIARIADVDDRALTELLKEIKDKDEAGLLGTGYDEQMLAALVMVTRPASEIANFDAAKEWVGMPDFDPGSKAFYLTVQFQNADDRLAFLKKAGISESRHSEFSDGAHWSMWWPERDINDLASVQLVESDE
jgi:hypothetical protein